MAKDDPHFRLRIPGDLKDAVEKAASENGRSINAEIVYRLSSSFAGAQDGIDGASNDTLYVLLDANGLPLSWQEIMVHLGEIQKAADLNIQNIDVRVVDTNLLPNTTREKEFFDLLMKYRMGKQDSSTDFDYMVEDGKGGMKPISVELKRVVRDGKSAKE